MRTRVLLLTIISFLSVSLSQNITLQPVQDQMVCGVKVPGLARQSFALGVPETIGSAEGMILNFPDVTINWTGPDQDGVVRHSWTTPGTIFYSIALKPFSDYVDMEMSITNLSGKSWTGVFSFNCLNPVSAPQFLDWTLSRTYMSRNGQPFRMDGTTRINAGSMKTVQFYLNKSYTPVSPFVTGFSATSPDRTDDSYIVTISEDGTSYMAATSPKANFLFDNLDRCCIHSCTDFGTIGSGQRKTVNSRFFFGRGTLSDFIARFNSEIKNASAPRVAMCWGSPWDLADTTQWNGVYDRLGVYKFYIGDIQNANSRRVDTVKAKLFVKRLVEKGIRIGVEVGGLLDWYADRGERSAEFSFAEDYSTLKTLIRWINEVNPSKSIDFLDFDGPIRRMLYPNNVQKNYHTVQSATTELFKIAKSWKDTVRGIELNLLTNFPNWAWRSTPAYFQLFGSQNGYGRYEDVLSAVRSESQRTGIRFDGLTIDNPYDYATGAAATNQALVIRNVDWMGRIAELVDSARAMGLRVNMIFNTNGGQTAQGYSEQSLALIDLYRQRVGEPDGFWIQSWYDLPGTWLPETIPYTMTNLTLAALNRIAGISPPKKLALLEPADGKVYHGACLMTYETGPDPIGPYLAALNDPSIHPAVRSFFFSVPGERGPANPLKGLKDFFHSADSIRFIPELSLFFTGAQGSTDSIIAVSTAHDWIIDSIITLSKNYGRKMFLRIGGEFNGAGPNWNGGGYHPYYYVTMFRKIVDRFSQRGLRDSIATNWCYEPDATNDFDSVDARGARWYPGDSYVDWFGLDVFDPQHFDQSLPDKDRRGITKKGKSERFLAMARAKSKPVYLNETSAKGMNISNDSSDGINDWNNWFAKFWRFFDAHQEIKGFNYINANWPVSAYPDWGDARIQNNPNVTAKYREEMRKSRYIHLPTPGITSVGSDVSVLPGEFRLEQNYPNPFNPITTIEYTLPRTSVVSLKVSDLLGREVAILIHGRQPAGKHLVRWDASGCASGIYFYTLRGEDFVSTKKLLLIR
jgi:hypothetical protein